MDELSMIIVLSNFGVFIFFAICVFAYNNRDRHDFKEIIASSASYTIALSLFYYDVRNLTLNQNNPFLTFFTCFFLFMGLILFVRSLTRLYQVESKIDIKFALIYILTMAIAVAYVSYKNEFFLRAILFYSALIIPLVIVLIYQYKSKVITMFNLISAQIYILFVCIVANTVGYILYDCVLDFTNPPEFTKAFLMIVNILLLTLVFSFIIERNGQDILELKEKGSVLENMFNQVKVISETDELTKAYNRRKIKEIIEMLTEKFDRTHTPYSVLLVDIDEFKKINDKYGHNIGDKVLKYITECLESVTRESDFVGRWGGDEFIVLLNNTSLDQAKIVKNKIQMTKKMFVEKDIRIAVSVSIGCSQSLVDLTYHQVIHKADLELYIDKNELNTKKQAKNS